MITNLWEILHSQVSAILMISFSHFTKTCTAHLFRKELLQVSRHVVPTESRSDRLTIFKSHANTDKNSVMSNVTESHGYCDSKTFPVTEKAKDALSAFHNSWHARPVFLVLWHLNASTPKHHGLTIPLEWRFTTARLLCSKGCKTHGHGK